MISNQKVTLKKNSLKIFFKKKGETFKSEEVIKEIVQIYYNT